MSYKAFTALKEHVELEAIKKMSPEEINAHFNRQHDRINELEKMLTKKLDLIKCGIGANYSGDPYENELYMEASDLLKSV